MKEFHRCFENDSTQDMHFVGIVVEEESDYKVACCMNKDLPEKKGTSDHMHFEKRNQNKEIDHSKEI